MEIDHKRLGALAFVLVLVVSTFPLGMAGTAEATPASNETFTVQQSGQCYVVQPYGEGELPAHVEWIEQNYTGHIEGDHYKNPDWNGPVSVESVMDYRFRFEPDGVAEEGSDPPIGQYQQDTPYLYYYHVYEPWKYSTYGLYNWSENGESHMFFYDGPDGISLVMRHDRLYDTTRIDSHDPYNPNGYDSDDEIAYGGGYTQPSPGGGAATFEFENLPQGDWAYLDDVLPKTWTSDQFGSGSESYYHWNYDAYLDDQPSSDDYNSYTDFHGGSFTADWSWSDGQNDGGAYRGFENLNGEVTINPRFNQNATMWNRGVYEGTHESIDSWEIRDARTGEWHTLNMDESLTITRGSNCENYTPAPQISDFGISGADDGTRDVTVQFDSDRELTTVGVSITGPDGYSETLRLDDFTPDGGTYTAPVTLPADGDYTATLNTAANDGGDGADGQQDSVMIDTEPTTTTTTEEPTPTTTTTTTEEPTTTTTSEPTTEEPDPDPQPSNPGGSASYGGGASPPSVLADVEQTGENSVTIDVQNAREDENVDFRLPADAQTMEGLRFTGLDIDMADDDSHFVLDVSTSADAPADVPEIEGADATMGYVQVGHEYLDDEQVKSATFDFTVSKARLDEAGLAAEDVSLYRRHGGEWTKLNTSVVEEKQNRYVLKAASPGFSTFAVAGTKTVSVTDLSLTASTIEAGGNATLSATVENTGASERAYVAELTLDDRVVDSKEVSVAAGGTGEVTFSRTFETAGNYRLSVGDASADLVVEKRETSETTDGVSTSIEGGGAESDGQPGFGPLAALVALVGAMLLARRRR